MKVKYRKKKKNIVFSTNVIYGQTIEWQIFRFVINFYVPSSVYAKIDKL